MRARTAFEERLLALIDPMAADAGFELVRLRVQGRSGDGQRLQIMAERPDGTMGVDDCASLSRQISAALDVEDPFTHRWELEVSSPGIDRPLTQLTHFARWEGFDVRIELDRMVENRKCFKGVLAGVEEDAEAVLIDLDGEDETAQIPLAWMVEARLVMTDTLITESLRRGSATLAPETDYADAEDAPVEEDALEEPLPASPDHANPAAAAKET